MQTRFLWLQERVRARDLETKKVSTDHNPSDLGTKAHTEQRTQYLLKLCGFAQKGTGSAKTVSCLSFFFLFVCGNGLPVAGNRVVSATPESYMGDLWTFGFTMIILFVVTVIIQAGRGSGMPTKIYKNVSTQTELVSQDVQNLLDFRRLHQMGIDPVLHPVASAPPQQMQQITSQQAVMGATCVMPGGSGYVAQIQGSTLPQPTATSNYESMTVMALRKLLREKGLITTGLKSELIQRLIDEDARCVIVGAR